MNLRFFVLLVALAGVAYAAVESTETTTDGVANLESSKTNETQTRQKRFLLHKLLMKKAFLVGGALGLGAAGLLSGRGLGGGGMAHGSMPLFGGYPRPSYNHRPYHEPYLNPCGQPTAQPCSGHAPPPGAEVSVDLSSSVQHPSGGYAVHPGAVSSSSAQAANAPTLVQEHSAPLLVESGQPGLALARNSLQPCQPSCLNAWCQPCS